MWQQTHKKVQQLFLVLGTGSLNSENTINVGAGVVI